MKLELKHLAPYLPYGLKIGKIKGFEAYRLMVCTENNSEEINIDPCVRLQYKPILRPLSDLTEKELRGQGFWHHIDFLIYDKADTTHIPYNMVVYLLSNHFDVFKLIDNGLAIDINTVKTSDL